MGYPAKQGLYDPRFEHDACGVGFVVDIHGRASHRILKDALTVLVNLDHRGARGCDAATGDGAGVLMQIPHTFFKAACPEMNLLEPGHYAVGMVFLPPDPPSRTGCETGLEKIIADEGLRLLGWRTVPTDGSSLGPTARSCEPVVRQFFIARPDSVADDLGFERKLYVVRKRAENLLRHAADAPGGDTFYISSLSARTIVYKGMLIPYQVTEFYPDLLDERMETALALVHSRFSTNTFPSWERAHPNRYIIHNGEINTLRGNVNGMHAREGFLGKFPFGDDLPKVLPVIDPNGSDSAMFDNVLEFLVLGGRSLAHSVMMMVPEPYAKHESMSDARKAFYEYHNSLMEPWDGPAAVGFTDGVQIGAVLDRNGLRPARYYVTTDGRVILSSEVGVLDIPAEEVSAKGRLQPGRMLLVDTAAGRIVNDEELKEEIAAARPYRSWLNDNLIPLEKMAAAPRLPMPDRATLTKRQRAFGYTYEDLRQTLGPMAQNAMEPIGSMGIDTPLAVLSDRSKLLYDYFKQLFAQVTNPPIDAIREEVVTSAERVIGPERDLLRPEPASCRQIKLKNPILSNKDLARIRHNSLPGLKAATLPILYKVKEGAPGLERAMEYICREAERAIEYGINILILSDRGVDKDHAPIPALLAVAGLTHHLVRTEKRTQVGLVLESGEPREVHHMALLLGYGVGAVNPYLAYETLHDMIRRGMLPNLDTREAEEHYAKGLVKGVVKTMSKMGISTIQSYGGAQIFEAVGISSEVIEKYFTWTPSRIEGVGIEEITREVEMRHSRAFADRETLGYALDAGGNYQWRSGGEYHLYNPWTITMLQQSCRTGNYAQFKDYTRLIDEQNQKHYTLRGLMTFKEREPVPLDEVEPVDVIVKRFKTGAMSYGSISKETHEALAIAMNRLGGRSNTGEGGEDSTRFVPEPNGDSKCSAIKQVASGRFGVTSEYLVNAQELQIKMAQGAKPGEGGQLPGNKVYPWIARVRHSTPGVGLISPPPHHDIYSIEDLAELIHDLKNANDKARISVKLVSVTGVGTIAAGVAKAHADLVLISGYDGGTGASPQSSIRHAGTPWELGLAETHQTLVLNNLRSRIRVEADGKLLTGRDVAIAALLGAEEFGFATAPLVVLGCVMMRVCHLDTCPVGIATQNPALRDVFTGDPAHVENFMRFIAQDLREWMAKLGFRTIDEMVGRSDVIEANKAAAHWKAKGVDLSAILYQPVAEPEVGVRCTMPQDHGVERSLDAQTLIPLCEPALERGEKVSATLPIRNTNRVTGTMLGAEVTRRYGAEGLPEGTIRLRFEGSAGQSFGAFVPKGISLTLEGDANDYMGKGLSGGKITVFPPKASQFVAEENILIGNVALYGATGGEAFIRGVAGERFAVRNSGATAVVEGVGDHGCEYMTAGRVVVLGKTGRNFAAGMSGGVAWVLDERGDFATRCNTDMVDLERIADVEEAGEVRRMVERHAVATGSEHAAALLDRWEDTVTRFVKVMPRDYRRMLDAIGRIEANGVTGDEAVMAAFEENRRDLARAAGN